MSRHQFAEEIFAQAVLGLIGLAFAWYKAFQGTMNLPWVTGFLFGLLGGFISFGCLEVHRMTGGQSRVLGLCALLTSPLVAVPIMPLSAALAVGYFPGYGVTFLFGGALVTLLKRYSRIAEQN